jgi:hypothetical protein
MEIYIITFSCRRIYTRTGMKRRNSTNLYLSLVDENGTHTVHGSRYNKVINIIIANKY